LFGGVKRGRREGEEREGEEMRDRREIRGSRRD
jgi:hypothetical protein